MSLVGVPLPELRRVHAAVVRGDLSCPLSRTGVLRCGFEAAWEALSPLSALDKEGLGLLLAAVIAEREAARGAELDLVWTGPDLQRGVTRDTAAVVRELLSRAEREVVIGGCYFTGGEDIFRPLHRAMRERGVQVTFCMDVGEAYRVSADPAANALRCAQAFMQDNWPFGRPLPNFYFDPRTAERKTLVKLHAKCIVVDEGYAFVTSANFTRLGQTQNMEVGVLIRDRGFAGKLARQFHLLIEDKKMIPCAVPDTVEAVSTVVPEGWEDAVDCVPAELDGLLPALLAAQIPAPDDCGVDLLEKGRTTGLMSLVTWQRGKRWLSLAQVDGEAARFDGEVIAVRAGDDWEAVATRVVAWLKTELKTEPKREGR